MKRALILGVNGQDGSFLADVLLERDYEVHGMVRRSSVDNLGRIAHIRDRITLHKGDITDVFSLCRLLYDIAPDEVYNEADQDHVGWSRVTPIVSVDVTLGGVFNLLEAVRLVNDKIKVFQPCSATMFGDAPAPQNESTPLNPLSPYAVCKAAAYHAARYYRQCYGMFVSTAILYNHDSVRRTEDYLLNKLCWSAARIALGLQESIALGNIDQWVDIGYAKDYMEAAYAIMQLDKADDFVVGANACPSSIWLIRQLWEMACQAAGIKDDPGLLVTRDGQWDSERPTKLLSDCSKIRSVLGWRPRTTMLELVEMIVKHARTQLQRSK